MKISIYGDSFVTSGIFKSALINQIGNDHNFKLKDVNWPDTPFHNDYGCLLYTSPSPRDS